MPGLLCFGTVLLLESVPVDNQIVYWHASHIGSLMRQALGSWSGWGHRGGRDDDFHLRPPTFGSISDPGDDDGNNSEEEEPSAFGAPSTVADAEQLFIHFVCAPCLFTSMDDFSTCVATR